MGRVAFIAHRAEIEAEINAGWPLKGSYEKRQDQLGITYPQFVKYVHAIIIGKGAAKRAPVQKSPASDAPANEVLETPKETHQQQGSSNARHAPGTPRPTFNPNGVTKEGEPEALFGPGFIKPRKGS